MMVVYRETSINTSVLPKGGIDHLRCAPTHNKISLAVDTDHMFCQHHIFYQLFMFTCNQRTSKFSTKTTDKNLNDHNVKIHV